MNIHIQRTRNLIFDFLPRYNIETLCLYESQRKKFVYSSFILPYHVVIPEQGDDPGLWFRTSSFWLVATEIDGSTGGLQSFLRFSRQELSNRLQIYGL